MNFLERKISSGYYQVIVENPDFQTVYLVEDSWRPESCTRNATQERWSVWEWDEKGWPEAGTAPSLDEIKQDPNNGVYEEIATAPSKKEAMSLITVWSYAEQLGT